MLRSKDYAGDAELTAALDAYLANDSANPNTSLVYLNRAKYDLDRKCEQEEFFLNVLHHQTTNGFQDTGKFAELPTYTISVDGDLTAGILETLNAVVAAAGDTITVSVVDDGSSGANYNNGSVMSIGFFDNPSFTGAALFSVGLTLNNNAATTTFVVPSTVDGPLFGKATTQLVPDNEVTVALGQGADFGVYNTTNGAVLGYYNSGALGQAFTATLALNSGINASSFKLTAAARETGTNNAVTVNTNTTPVPTSFTFTPSAINNSLDGPVKLILDVFTI